MNKLNFLFLFILFINSVSSTTIFSYLMRLQCKNQSQKFLGYYKGKKVKFEDGICIFKDTEKPSTFILVVTPEISHKVTPFNTVYLERMLDKPCKIYYFTLQDNKWAIEEASEEDMPKRLADSSFIILIDPKHINQIDNKVMSKSLDNFIYLPTIYLNAVDKSEMDLIALSSLDSNRFHVCQNDLKLAKNTSVISIPERL